MFNPFKSIDNIDSTCGSYIIEPTTINNLIADHGPDNNTLDAISVTDYIQGLTLRLPIICTVPMRVGYFSLRVNDDGESEEYLPDKSTIPYLRKNYQSLKNIDLIEGFCYKPKNHRILPSNQHIFRWIIESPNPELYTDINFICTSSRFLNAVLNVPYNGAVSWTTLVFKINRKIYLTSRDPNVFVQRGGTFTYSQVTDKHITHKLSELLAVQENGSPTRTFPNGNRDSFYTVNKLEIGQHKILYPSQVDFALDLSQHEDEISKIRIAQLRHRPVSEPNSKENETSNDDVVRSISWWLAAFLGGAESVICGERSRQFEVKSISSLSIEELFQVQRPNGVNWTPKRCIEHLKKTLSFIQSHVKEEKVVYRFRWNRHRQNIEFRKLREKISKFVPHWYTEEQKRKITCSQKYFTWPPAR